MSRKTLALRHQNQKVETKSNMQAIRAVKMISLLALRNQGWGHQRLRKFSNDFNDILYDVSNGHLSLSDIPDTIYDETGLSMTDLEI